MKRFKVKVNDKSYILYAKSYEDAVRKLRDKGNILTRKEIDTMYKAVQEGWKKCVRSDREASVKLSKILSEIQELYGNYTVDENTIDESEEEEDTVGRLRDTKITDARTYLEMKEIDSIKKEAESISGEFVTIRVSRNYDEKGYYIEEIYVSSSGERLKTLSEVNKYIRELENASKFMTKYAKYAENNR